MLYVDIPTAADMKALASFRSAHCVSIYLPTTPLSRDADHDRIALKNLAKEAVRQLSEAGADKRETVALAEHLDDLIDDDEFWRFQAHSLAVLATPDNVRTFRVPNTFTLIVEVADRFFLKPLMRTVAFPNACYVLALAEGSVRLIEASANLPATTVKVDGLPKDAASAVGRSSVNDRSPSGRIHGSEGQKVLLRQFARKVDGALRSLLSGSEIPLVLAAAQPLDAIYRSVNTYPHLVGKSISGSPGAESDARLAEQARSVLDDLYRQEIAALAKLFDSRENEDRATTDIARAARAATHGAVDTLLIDIDEVIDGEVDEATGAVTFSDRPTAGSYGVVDEIASRVILSGGRVVGGRKSDIPNGKSLAAILRYPV